MALMVEDVQFEVAGRPFAALLAKPAGVPRAGVVILHGGGGIEAHERTQLERFSDLGYIALAPDLFGEAFTDRAHGMRVIGELVATPSLLRARVTGALLTLATYAPGVPLLAVGHCFGGFAALELARTGADVRAVVSLHGRLVTAQPAKPGDIRARVLACTGAGDPFCSASDRAVFEAEMTAAGVDWQHQVYGGALHGFSVPGIERQGCAYHEAADRRSWRAALALFDEAISQAEVAARNGREIALSCRHEDSAPATTRRNDMTTNNQTYTATIELAKSPHHVFECILDVPKWWGGKDLKGRTRRLGDEFTITHGDVHYSRQRMVELVPDRKVVWLITESTLAWLERDKHEWTGTKLVFEVAPKDDGTALQFTHEGLVPEQECYSRCSEGWNLVIKEYLANFIAEGRVAAQLYA
jgi:dienelactone hydrolase